MIDDSIDRHRIRMGDAREVRFFDLDVRISRFNLSPEKSRGLIFVMKDALIRDRIPDNRIPILQDGAEIGGHDIFQAHEVYFGCPARLAATSAGPVTMVPTSRIQPLTAEPFNVRFWI